MSAGITIRNHPSPGPTLRHHGSSRAWPGCCWHARRAARRAGRARPRRPGHGGHAGARPAAPPSPTTRPPWRSTRPTTRPTGAPRSPCSIRASRSPTASRAPSATRSTPARSAWPAAPWRPTRSGADGHFALAAAVGRASLSMGKKERIRRARIIRDEALRAIALDPRHDGAYHILGRWNAEIMRLSGFSRFFAKWLLGAGIFGEASWEGAVSNMEQAVALDPGRLYHRLELARDLRRPEALRRRARPARASWRPCPTARSWTASTGGEAADAGRRRSPTKTVDGHAACSPAGRGSRRSTASLQSSRGAAGASSRRGPLAGALQAVSAAPRAAAASRRRSRRAGLVAPLGREHQRDVPRRARRRTPCRRRSRRAPVRPRPRSFLLVLLLLVVGHAALRVAASRSTLCNLPPSGKPSTIVTP